MCGVHRGVHGPGPGFFDTHSLAEEERRNYDCKLKLVRNIDQYNVS